MESSGLSNFIISSLTSVPRNVGAVDFEDVHQMKTYDEKRNEEVTRVPGNGNFRKIG